MKRIGENKSAQQMTLTTIIAIVLGVVVLVLLVFGFSTGWKNLWSRVTLYGAGSGNTDTVAQTCALACSSGNKYGFCEQDRKVVIDEGLSNNAVSCKDLTGAVEFTKAGATSKTVSNIVAPCPTITC